MEDRCVCCGSIIPEGRQVCPMCEKERYMNEKDLIRITIDEMIAEMLGHIRNDTCYPTYYWKHEDKGFLEIVECDLFGGKIIMEDGDFSYFTWEMDADSNIYRLAI